MISAARSATMAHGLMAARYAGAGMPAVSRAAANLPFHKWFSSDASGSSSSEERKATSTTSPDASTSAPKVVHRPTPLSVAPLGSLFGSPSLRHHLALMDNMHRAFFGGSPLGGLGLGSSRGPLGDGLFADSHVAAEWAPRADITETETAYEIAAELPGVKREDVRLHFENGVLTISGTKVSEHVRRDGGRVLATERASGTFARAVQLPDGTKADDISAKYEDGVLRVAIKKPEPAAQASTAIPIA
eukprot:Amastigsp_a187039_24.p1 type:complete len:246 gc:universal Amastigsp_a187039_24:832-95(-)